MCALIPGICGSMCAILICRRVDRERGTDGHTHTVDSVGGPKVNHAHRSAQHEWQNETHAMAVLYALRSASAKERRLASRAQATVSVG